MKLCVKQTSFGPQLTTEFGEIVEGVRSVSTRLQGGQLMVTVVELLDCRWQVDEGAQIPGRGSRLRDRIKVDND